MDEKVSVIIPTYNRFFHLKNAIQSVKNQTYKNLEIIIINDASTQEEYYKTPFEGCIVIHQPTNSKKLFGFSAPGYVRNFGILKASGTYIAFLDDDDYWLPSKLELQLETMKRLNTKMSCSEGLYGEGFYNEKKHYERYNRDHFWNKIPKSQKNGLENEFPDIWDYNFLKENNSAISSSVIVHRDIISKVGLMSYQNFAEDYEYWLRCLKYTNLAYVREPNVYVNASIGYSEHLNFKKFSTKQFIILLLFKSISYLIESSNRSMILRKSRFFKFFKNIQARTRLYP